MKTAVFATMLTASAIASAKPVKIGDHTLDFKRPPGFKVSETAKTSVWVGEYNRDKPDRHIALTAVAHPTEDPIDLARQFPKLDQQMLATGLEPDGDAEAIAANGFVGRSRHYLTNDPKKPSWGVAALIDAGPVMLVVLAAGSQAPNDLTKATLALLGTLTVDGKKGPAAYAKN